MCHTYACACMLVPLVAHHVPRARQRSSATGLFCNYSNTRCEDRQSDNTLPSMISSASATMLATSSLQDTTSSIRPITVPALHTPDSTYRGCTCVRVRCGAARRTAAHSTFTFVHALGARWVHVGCTLGVRSACACVTAQAHMRARARVRTKRVPVCARAAFMHAHVCAWVRRLSHGRRCGNCRR